MNFRKWLDITYRMLRLRTVLMMWLFLALGEVSSRTTASPSFRLLIPAAAIAMLFINATCINDLADEKIDVANLKGSKDRPLLDNTASRRELVQLGVLAALLSIGLSALAGPPFLALVVLVLIVNYTYSMPPLQISYRGLIAIPLLTFLYVAAPFLMGVWVNSPNLSQLSWGLLVALLVSFVGRIILKDFRDVIGDRQYGKRTFLVRYGANATTGVAIAAWLAGDLLLVKVLSHNGLFIIIVQVFVLAIIWSLRKLSSEPSLPQQLVLISLVGRLGNSVALMVLVLLSLRFYSFSPLKANIMLVAVVAMGAYTSYFLYELYRLGQRTMSAHELLS